MHKTALIALLIGTCAAAFDISVEKPKNGGTYYRFWFVYGLIAIIMAIILIIATSVSMCRRYKLVASQEDEISEIQWN